MSYPIYKLSQKIQVPNPKAKDDNPGAKLSEILAKCGFVGIVYVWNAFPPDERDAFILRDCLSIKEQADKYITTDFIDIGLPSS